MLACKRLCAPLPLRGHGDRWPAEACGRLETSLICTFPRYFYQLRSLGLEGKGQDQVMTEILPLGLRRGESCGVEGTGPWFCFRAVYLGGAWGARMCLLPGLGQRSHSPRDLSLSSERFLWPKSRMEGKRRYKKPKLTCFNIFWKQRWDFSYTCLWEQRLMSVYRYILSMQTESLRLWECSEFLTRTVFDRDKKEETDYNQSFTFEATDQSFKREVSL